MAPSKFHGNSTIGGVPSVMVSRDNVANGKMAAVLKERIADCNGFKPNTSDCQDIQIYQDLTGNLGAEQPKGVSISPSFREAIFHVISGSIAPGWTQEKFDAYYSLGSGSYFGESAIVMDGRTSQTDFKQRYWAGQYDQLLKTKQKYDPENFFWCRNCVGSDL
jgi:hypothetical protein